MRNIFSPNSLELQLVLYCNFFNYFACVNSEPVILHYIMSLSLSKMLTVWSNIINRNGRIPIKQHANKKFLFLKNKAKPNPLQA